MGKKVIVIGGGPGGYSAALRAAGLGADVTLIEQASPGGVCLNEGCVPTKALLHVAANYHRARSGSVPGLRLTGAELDWEAAMRYKEGIIAHHTAGLRMMFKHAGVTLREGRAELRGAGSVNVGGETIAADAIIVATGSVSAALGFPGAELPGVIDSAAALSLDSVPSSVLIVGGGVIGVEFATMLRYLGAETTIIEAKPRLLPLMDEDISDFCRANMADNGIDIHTSCAIVSAETGAEGLTARFSAENGEQSVTAEKIIIAVGRTPNTQGMGLLESGVRISRGAIDVDENYMTSVPGIYAVGDCIGRTMLAHAAMSQGETAAEQIMGCPSARNNVITPACVFADPELASVGLTEEQAKDSGADYRVGLSDMNANSKATLEGKGGFVKIIADSRFGELLGVHIAGRGASELIAEAALCMSLEGTAEDIAGVTHAHPTVSEAMKEAAKDLLR